MNKIEYSQYYNSFADIITTKPWQTNEGGLNTHGLFFLYCVLKELKPKVVIESGIWKGVSTWLIEKTLPNTDIICIDPPALGYEKVNPNWFVYKSKTAQYSSVDFLEQTFNLTDPDEALVFFDDHQDHGPRINHCYNLGITNIILDDNYKSKAGSHVTLYCYQNLEEFKDILKCKVIYEINYNDFLLNSEYWSLEPKNTNSNMTYIKLDDK